MSEENKNLTPEENEEVTPVEETAVAEEIEEVAEETVEDANETVEEAAELAQEAVEDVQEAVEEAAEVIESAELEDEEVDEEVAQIIEEAISEPDYEMPEEIVVGEDAIAPESPAQKISKPLIAGIACVLVLIIVAVVLFVNGGKWFNKYNRKYIDITGRTIGEVADENGYDFNDFLVAMELPLDMPENTYESAAVYSRKLSTMATIYGMSVDDLKELLGLGDEVTEDTTWGDAYDMATLEKIVGEEGFEVFKEQYGLGEEVTLETKWGEIRKIVDQYERDRMLEEKQAEEEAAKAEQESLDETSDTEETTEPTDAQTE